MKLIDELVQTAGACDAAMGKLADRGERAEQRVKAFANLESQLDQMAADGVLDRGEIEKLKADFRAAGLDTKVLDELAKELKGVDGTVQISGRSVEMDQLRDALRNGKFEARDSDFAAEAQMLMSQYNQAFDLASRVAKGEHEIYMTAIRHLAC